MHKENGFGLTKIAENSRFFVLFRAAASIAYNSQRNTFNFPLDKPPAILYNDLVVRDI